MKAYNSHEKRALLYAITDTDSTPLDLMNVQSFKEGELDSVATFIGRHDRDEYVKIADAINLSDPGTVFNYSRFVRQQENSLGSTSAYTTGTLPGRYTQEATLITLQAENRPRRTN